MRVFILIISVLILSSCGWISEAESVAQDEFGATGSLKKYEWFKNASESISEKEQTIAVYEANLKDLVEDYKGIDRVDWDRLDKQQYNQWRLEVVGMKASYNKVVKEYNSQSSKFNWSFYNTTDLPRSYSLYLNK